VTREHDLVAAFFEVAGTLVDDFDLIEFLHTLTENCVRVLEVDAAGLMLVDLQGRLHAGAVSDEDARMLELFELQTDAGPCLDAYRSGLPVVNADLHANHERWPTFAQAAEAAGYVSVQALPLRLRARVIGALNLFRVRPGPLSEQDMRTGQALADVATIGILAQRTLRQSELTTVQLRNALTSRVAIEQAKGVMAERHHITVDAAFALLHDYARSHQMQLSEVCRIVVLDHVPAVGPESR